MLLDRTKNKKICQMIWVFVIHICRFTKKLLDAATKTGLDAAENACKKIAHKTETT